MYRPIQNKPFAVDTDYDADGTPKKEWRNYESKTERALRECANMSLGTCGSASVQGTQVENGTGLRVRLRLSCHCRQPVTQNI